METMRNINQGKKIMDMHCDTIGYLFGTCGDGLLREEDNLRKNHIHLDLEKMLKSGYSLQTFAMFIDQKSVLDPFGTTLELISYYNKEMKANEDIIKPLLTYKDLLQNEAQGKLSGLLAIEGGEAICGSLEKLHEVYDKGVRLMTLTWNYVNELGHPNVLMGEDGTPDFISRNPLGLTPAGVEIVQEMEHIGMIVDTSHLSDGGFWDVYHNTKKPFVASHSNAAAVRNVSRNLKDDMIKALAERGGVAGLNFCEWFLGEGWSEYPEVKAQQQLDAMVNHVKYMVDKGGIEICALGTDFDGIDESPLAIPDASYMYRLLDALRKSGFSENQIDLFCHGNVRRVLQEILV